MRPPPPDPSGLSVAFFIALVIVLAFAAVMLTLPRAHSRDLGQWHNDPEVAKWYRTLMRPDLPTGSCCGEADAYWCDDIHVRNGKTFCKITDDRDDKPRGRPHRDLGEEFEIPPEKLKWDEGNPTGHAIIFLSMSGYVFCFVQGGGT